MSTEPSSPAGDGFDALSELLVMDAPIADIAERALEIGTDRLGVAHGHFTRIVPELNHWEAVASTDSADGPVPTGTVAALDTTFCRRAVANDELVALHDVPDQGYADDVSYQEYGWECYASSPVKLGDELYGTLCFANAAARSQSFSADERAFITCLSHVLEQKLAHRQSELALSNVNKLLAVLSRVLRHNLRNDMTVVRGHLDLLISQLQDPTVDPETLTQTVDRIIRLAEKSRQLRRIANADHAFHELNIVSLIEQVAKEVDEAYPGVDVQISAPEDVSLTTLPTIEMALYELIENVAKHTGSDPTCRIQIEPTVDDLTIEVRDTGPGLPPHEQNVLAGQTETALEHGQGIGLWIVYWVCQSLDGSVAIETQTGGTTVRLTIPRPGTNELLTTDELTE